MIDYKTEWYEKVKPNYRQFDEFMPEYWEMKYLDRWADILALLPDDKLMDIKLLDVGCGMGRASYYFNKFGCQCTGVEPSEYAASVARERGVKVINDYFMAASISETFDVIHLEQVLSHMPDAELAIEKSFSLLNDNGVLVLEEPNDNNPLQKILEKKYGKYWVVDDHVNYFDYDSMLALLEKTGFKVEDVSCTYPMEMFALMGFEYIGNDEIGRKVHAMRYRLEEGLGQHKRGKLLRSFAEQKIGRDLIFYCKRGNK